MKHSHIHFFVIACSILVAPISYSEQVIGKRIVQSISQFPEALQKNAECCASNAQIIAVGTALEMAKEDFKKGDYQSAIDRYKEAISLDPSCALTYYDLGLAYLAIKDHLRAKEAFIYSRELDPTYTHCHYFLGYIYYQEGDYRKAIDCYNDILDLDPDYFDAYINKARALVNSGNIDDAITCYEEALKIQSVDLAAHLEVAYLYNHKGDIETAAKRYRQAALIEPNHVEINCNLAHMLRYSGNMKEAIPFYEKVIAQNDTHAHAHCGLAECYLATGKLDKGFYHFERRLDRIPDSRRMKENHWDGVADLRGKTLLIRTEFGLGDTIQYARYFPLLKQKGARIVLEVQPSLARLMILCPYVDDIVLVQDPVRQLPAHDYQIPIVSLPRIFKTTIDTIPTNIPYLETDPHCDAYWHEQLNDVADFKVGICWQGGIYYEQHKSPYAKKDISLEAFKPLSQIPGVKLYSLQKMNGTEELLTLPIDMDVHDFGNEFDMAHGRFMDTASVIKEMNIVITVDTSVAHLAGALGAPTWLLLPYVADGRWLQERTDSLWYPQMKLFRQPKPSDWQTVIQSVATELEQTLYGSSKKASPIAEVSIGELIDKISILGIKTIKIKDKAKLRNVHNELRTLTKTFNSFITKEQQTEELNSLIKELDVLHLKLWEIEDDIREKEARGEFDEEFIELARSVYFTNDKRGEIKNKINKILGSFLVEEKLYTKYR